MKMLLENIIIPESFKRTPPKRNKLYACQRFYETYGKMDRDIYINQENVLINGYAAYLVYKQAGVKKVKIKRTKNSKDTPNRKKFFIFLIAKR